MSDQETAATAIRTTMAINPQSGLRRDRVRMSTLGERRSRSSTARRISSRKHATSCHSQSRICSTSRSIGRGSASWRWSRRLLVSCEIRRRRRCCTREHAQSRIRKRNVFLVTAAPKFQVVIQEQVSQHAYGKRRRRTGNEDSHHLDYGIRRCSRIGIRNNIAAWLSPIFHS